MSRPKIKGLSIAGGVLDEMPVTLSPDMSDVDLTDAVKAAVAVDPVNDLADSNSVGLFQQEHPTRWTGPDPDSDPDPVADIQAMVKTHKRQFTITTPADPAERNTLLDMLLNETRNGRSIILPNNRESQFEYDEDYIPPMPEPNDGLRRPEMK